MAAISRHEATAGRGLGAVEVERFDAMPSGTRSLISWPPVELLPTHAIFAPTPATGPLQAHFTPAPDRTREIIR